MKEPTRNLLNAVAAIKRDCPHQNLVICDFLAESYQDTLEAIPTIDATEIKHKWSGEATVLRELSDSFTNVRDRIKALPPGQ